MRTNITQGTRLNLDTAQRYQLRQWRPEDSAIIWWDASDPSAVQRQADQVIELTDKGLGNYSYDLKQATSSKQPSYTEHINDLSVVSFNENQAQCLISDSLSHNMTDYAFSIVCKPLSYQNKYAAVISYDGDTNDWQIDTNDDDSDAEDTFIGMLRLVSNSSQPYSSTNMLGKLVMFSFIADHTNSELKVYENGRHIRTLTGWAGFDNTSDIIKLAVNRGGSVYTSMHFCEAMFVPISEWRFSFNYLLSKWGVDAGFNTIYTVWDTTIMEGPYSPTDDHSIRMPLTAANARDTDCVIDWGDGSYQNIVTADLDNSSGVVHTYSTPGIKHIKVTGSVGGFSFGWVQSDRLKILEMRSWGDMCITGFASFAHGTHMKITAAKGGPVFYHIESGLSTFYNTHNITSVNMTEWDLSTIDKLNGMFHACRDLTELIGLAIPNNIKELVNFIRDCSNTIDVDFTECDFSNITDMSNFATSTVVSASISPEAYDGLLNTIANNPHQTGVQLDVKANYTAAGANARNQLTDISGWSITDQGPI
jgi:hypothetical protein